MSKQFHLIVFGDQAVPYHKELQKLLAKKDNTVLAAFIADAYRALRAEISRLSGHQRSQVPNSSTLGGLLAAVQSSGKSFCALDSALACLHQLAAFISYLNESREEYPQPASTCLIGSCIGLISATAVSCSKNVIDLVTFGPQFVALAFRLGLLVQEKTATIVTVSDTPESFSSLVGSIDLDSASYLLQEFNRHCGLSSSSRLYVSAVGHDTVTISGPPERLFDFCSQYKHLKTLKVPVSGLFHASHLYNAMDMVDILETLERPAKSLESRLNILTNSDGQILKINSCESLLKVMLWEIIGKQLRWDMLLEKVSSVVSNADAPEVVIKPFAANGIQSLTNAFKTNKNRVVRVANTTIKIDQDAKRSKIAIIGFSGRYPEADSNEEFWNLLFNGLDVHKEIPKDRFDPWLYYDPTFKKKNTSGVTKGCFIREPGLFDARFFTLSPREAEQSDPAQRIAMMTAYEAMEMAGFVPDATPSSRRDRVGVFYGTASDDYRECNSGQSVDTYFIPGGSRAFLPGRVNYHWRFSGPSLDVDTACASSLAAIHIACNSLWTGDCDTVFAGGTNVLTNPDNWAGLDRGHFLSRTGNCNTFDDGADGYCRSEGVATVIMKRLEDAELDGDPIFGTILGAYTNHSAEAVSMTRPHSGAQRAIFNRILTGACVEGAEVSYVEMHGTGTQHGDACEMDSVLSVFAPNGAKREEPLFLGSAKANIGHAESASGVASLVKVLLMMEKNVLPRHVGIKTKINRNFPTDLTERNILIPFKMTPWPRPADKPYGRRAFVNNFGAAGGNSSLLVEDAPLQHRKGLDPRPLHAVALSAKTQYSLKENIRSLREFIAQNSDASLSSLSYTTTARRIHHNFRAIVSGESLQDIHDALGKQEKSDFKSTSNSVPDVGFCFTGQGSQYLGMGQQLLEIPQFKSIMMSLENILQAQGYQSVLPVIDGSLKTPLEELSPVVLQLSITCLQIALGKLWKILGIKPQLVIGHSLGEYAALNMAEVLSDADTIHIVGTRATLLSQLCPVGTGAMLAIKAQLPKVAALIHSRPALEIACVNHPDETVVAGELAEIATFAEEVTQLGLKGTQLKVQYAFHSAQVEPMLEAFRHSCRSIIFKDPQVSFISPLLGKVITSATEFGSPAAYLSRHCRETVNFCEGLQAASMAKSLSDKLVWIEIGPHPICSNMVKSTLGSAVRAFPTLRRKENAWNTLISTICTLYESGMSIDWSEYHDGFKQGLRVLKLPSYRWDLKEYWIPYMYDWCLTKGDPPLQNPSVLPGPSEDAVKQIFTASVQTIVDENHSSEEAWVTARSDVKYPDLLAILQGHKINGRSICTSSTYADMALTLFTRLLQMSPLTEKEKIGIEITDMIADKALQLNEEPSQLIELKATANWPARSAEFTMYSVSKHGKVTANHAKCKGFYTEKSKWTVEWKRREFLVKSRIEHLQGSIHDDSDSSAHFLKPGMFYKLFSSIVDYSDLFKGVREVCIRSADLECTAKVKFNTSVEEGTKWVCSPYWIESLGQITGFTLNGNDTLDTENYVYINHGWSNMRILKTLSPEETYRTYIKMQTDDNVTYSGDLYILDSDNKIVGVYEGVTFNALARKIFERVLPRPTVAGAKAPQELRSEPASAQITTSDQSHAPSAQPSLSAPVEIQPEAGESFAGRVKALISEEVGVAINDLKDDDDLVDLGVDSLLALTITDRIREVFDKMIDSTMFLSPLTVRELIQCVTGEQGSSDTESPSPPTPTSTDGDLESMSSSSITPPSSPPTPFANEPFGDMAKKSLPAKDVQELGDSLYSSEVSADADSQIPSATSILLQGNLSTATKTLWLFPDGSGLATSYLPLATIDAASVAVYGVNSPFVRKVENMSKCNFQQLTASYLKEIRRRQPHGPYYFGGWSAGGISAFDAAQALTSAGEVVERLVLLDSPNPIGLDKLPVRLYREFDQMGIFGTGPEKRAPAWLLGHATQFIDVLDTHIPRQFTGPRPLNTWVIWAKQGVAEDGSIAVLPDDPPNLRWLLLKRSTSSLCGNGWDQLVGEKNMTIEILDQANHFTMMKEPAVSQVSAFIRRAMS